MQSWKECIDLDSDTSEGEDSIPEGDYADSEDADSDWFEEQHLDNEHVTNKEAEVKWPSTETYVRAGKVIDI